jgi:hypothetical protein
MRSPSPSIRRPADPASSSTHSRIFGGPEKFLNRYNSVKKWKTLHRQFLRAKNEFEELDRTPPGPGLLLWPMSRDEMIKHLIVSYSAEAEVKRRGRVAQKSVKPKNA